MFYVYKMYTNGLGVILLIYMTFPILEKKILIFSYFSLF